MTAIAIGGIFAALFLFNYFSYKGWNQVFVSIFAACIVALLNSLDVFTSITSTFMAGGAGIVQALFFTFFGACIFAGIYAFSGASVTLAKSMLRILAKDGVTGTRGCWVVTLSIVIFMMLMTYGGMDAMATQMAVLPIVLSLLKECNLPRKLIPALLMVTYSSSGLPYQPGMTAQTCITLLGTTPGAAAIPGFIASSIGLTIGSIFLATSMMRCHKRGDEFKSLPNDPVLDDSIERPGVLHSLVPLIVIFLLFNIFQLHAGFCMLISAILSVFLYLPWLKKLAPQGDVATMLKKILSQRVGMAAEMCIFCFAVVGFGSVVQSTAVFSGMIETLIANSNGSVWVMALIIALTVGCVANSMAGLTIGIPMVAPSFLAYGVPATAIHRICSAATGTFDSLPISIGVVASHRISGVPLREGYKYVAFITVLVPWINTIILCTLYTVAPGLF